MVLCNERMVRLRAAALFSDWCGFKVDLQQLRDMVVAGVAMQVATLPAGAEAYADGGSGLDLSAFGIFSALFGNNLFMLALSSVLFAVLFVVAISVVKQFMSDVCCGIVSVCRYVAADGGMSAGESVTSHLRRYNRHHQRYDCDRKFHSGNDPEWHIDTVSSRN